MFADNVLCKVMIQTLGNFLLVQLCGVQCGDEEDPSQQAEQAE